MTKLFTLWRGYFMPLWMQPGLIPRNSERGDRFEVAAFFGREHNLAAELRGSSWQAELQNLGLAWRVVPRERFYDYGNVDVVVAVRSFANDDLYVYKPPSKLHNAWCAGVPAILGPESAYRAARQTELDYIEVCSPEEALTALRRLRDQVHVRQEMMRNGERRASEFRSERIVELWRGLLCNQLVSAYKRWRAAPGWMRSAFVSIRGKTFRRVMAKRYPDGIAAATYPRSPGPI
jgi:hypothetical protein